MPRIFLILTKHFCEEKSCRGREPRKPKASRAIPLVEARFQADPRNGGRAIFSDNGRES
jgi:hypothetical protein